MLRKLQKNKLPLNIKLFNVRWYPSNRSCVRRPNRPVKLQQMPPLMVRKAEWRRWFNPAIYCAGSPSRLAPKLACPLMSASGAFCLVLLYAMSLPWAFRRAKRYTLHWVVILTWSPDILVSCTLIFWFPDPLNFPLTPIYFSVILSPVIRPHPRAENFIEIFSPPIYWAG